MVSVHLSVCRVKCLTALCLLYLFIYMISQYVFHVYTRNHFLFIFADQVYKPTCRRNSHLRRMSLSGKQDQLTRMLAGGDVYWLQGKGNEHSQETLNTDEHLHLPPSRHRGDVAKIIMWPRKEQTNLSTKQPINKVTNKAINQYSDQATNQTTNQSNYQLTKQSPNQSSNQTISLTTKQPTN